jgi:hypothetical protein
MSAESRNTSYCMNAPASDVVLLSFVLYVGADAGVLDNAEVNALVVVVSTPVSLNSEILMRPMICKFFRWSDTLFVALWHCILIDTCP